MHMQSLREVVCRQAGLVHHHVDAAAVVVVEGEREGVGLLLLLLGLAILDAQGQQLLRLAVVTL
jgi:hypothetical protein